MNPDPELRTPPPGQRERPPLSKTFIPPLLAVAAGLAVWEAGVRAAGTPAYILPPPTAVLRALAQEAGPLFMVHLPATLGEAAVGLLLALVAGMALGLGMALSPALEKALYPLLVFSQTIPLVALSPLFILWFGYSLWSKAFVVLLTAFYPIMAGLHDGIRRAGSEYRGLMLAMGARRRQVLIKAEIPAALPAFFGGLRLAAVYSVIGATIGEWLGGSRGLGFYCRRMASGLRSADMFAAVVLLAALGLSLLLTVRLAEAVICRRSSLGRIEDYKEMRG
ncbi:ABC transporter permease [Paenibacillus glufosinatiresistens]|uniref:ABC transporter permease n=1 Tax=Paenibacillus glufosinatiresistens TaxID=3070657 RepID=UPI00286E50D1|nr:ABC transporter permease [Paenibacillus sp. YX.27]